jgi:Arc/MetJ-type ribon-helix-helix transcriptional regulator
MTKNVIQIRMPEKLAEDIEGLVKKGLYKIGKSRVWRSYLRYSQGLRTYSSTGQRGQFKDLKTNRNKKKAIPARRRRILVRIYSSPI